MGLVFSVYSKFFFPLSTFGFSNTSKSMIFPHGEERAYALPLNNPPVIKGSLATHMDPNDLIVGISFNGIIRAYPRWVLVSYHIVNDTINGAPLLVTHCEICSAASAFNPTRANLMSRSLSFIPCSYRKGTFSICDLQSNSLWHPFSGQALEGPLKGSILDRIPVKIVKWKNWLSAHPDTDVVVSSIEQKFRPHGHSDGNIFDIGNPYMPWMIARTANLKDHRLSRGTLVFGVTSGPDKLPFAVKLDGLAENSIRSFIYEKKNYFLFRGFDFSYLVFSINNSQGRKIFISSKTPLTFASENGGKWDSSGKFLDDSKIKINLELQDGYMTEWFEWVSNYPKTTICDY